MLGCHMLRGLAASLSVVVAAGASVSDRSRAVCAEEVIRSGGFTGQDALTLAPGLITVCVLTALVTSFLRGLSTSASTLREVSEALLPRSSGPRTSKPQTVFNICKNVGEGMLSLPSGVAAGTGLLGSMVIALGFCMMLGYTFSLMGRVCHATGGVRHKECGERSSGPRMAQVMAVTLMLKTVGTCLSYAIVIGDSFSSIAHFFGFVGVLTSRQASLISVVVLLIVPLCLQKDLSNLSYTSLLGLTFEVLVVLFMQVRFLDGSYAPGGQFYSVIDKQYVPGFHDGVDCWGTSITTFVLLGTLSNAYIAHYNAPKFFPQMEVQTVSHFNEVITLAFALCLIIYLWIMAVGYSTFGAAADGLILNNYAETDLGATLARLAIAFAVVFGFPLAFTACGTARYRPSTWTRRPTGSSRA